MWKEEARRTTVPVVESILQMGRPIPAVVGCSWLRVGGAVKLQWLLGPVRASFWVRRE